MLRYLFVGEKPSAKAFRLGYRWESGRLASATLGPALDHAGIEPENRAFLNLFGDDPDASEKGGSEMERRLALIAEAALTQVIVGMGLKVSRIMEGRGIAHRRIVHPAARGKIRKREVYIAHVVDALQV